MTIKGMGHSFFEFFKYSVLALIPILNIYRGIYFVRFGTLLLLLVMIIEIAFNRGRFEINKSLFLMMCFLATLNMITALFHMDTTSLYGCVNNTISILFSAVICGYFVKNNTVDSSKFYKYIRAVALISSIFLFVQYVFFLRGTILNGLIIPLISKETLEPYHMISIGYGRPNSFFLEPAHFATYVLPVFALSLYKKKYITGMILLAALVFSTSSTAIVIAVIVLGIYIFKEKSIPIIIKWVFVLAGLVVVSQFISLFYESEFFKKISYASLKSNIRVFGAVEYFKYFGVADLLFGVGFNQISNFMNYFVGVDNIKNYSNSLIFSFLSFGLIGAIPWNVYVARLYKTSRNKVLYIIFILVYFSDQILFGSNFIYLIFVLFAFSNKETPAQSQKLRIKA